jgi:hypothetical protein
MHVPLSSGPLPRVAHLLLELPEPLLQRLRQRVARAQLRLELKHLGIARRERGLGGSERGGRRASASWDDAAPAAGQGLLPHNACRGACTHAPARPMRTCPQTPRARLQLRGARLERLLPVGTARQQRVHLGARRRDRALRLGGAVLAGGELARGAGKSAGAGGKGA